MIKGFFILLMVCLMSDCASVQEENYRVIESYKQLSGIQVLDATGKVTIPLSKQGYTLHLPGSYPDATIIMLSGASLDTTRDLDEFEIIQPALEKNIAVLFVSTGKVIEFLFTDQDIRIIDEIIHRASAKYHLEEKPIYLLGMSLGGTMALRYHEYCALGKSAYGHQVDALAICDAPLDMTRLWHEQDQALKNNFHPNAVGEARWVMHFLQENLGGSPSEALESYIAYSPFVYRDEQKRKIDLFKDIPIRMYHEPDIEWWIKNRGKDYNTINSVDLAGFYNALIQAGNANVELITSYNKRKGFEEGSSPHTWTIVDNEEMVEWLLEVVK